MTAAEGPGVWPPCTTPAQAFWEIFGIFLENRLVSVTSVGYGVPPPPPPNSLSTHPCPDPSPPLPSLKSEHSPAGAQPSAVQSHRLPHSQGGFGCVGPPPSPTSLSGNVAALGPEPSDNRLTVTAWDARLTVVFPDFGCACARGRARGATFHRTFFN